MKDFFFKFCCYFFKYVPKIVCEILKQNNFDFWKNVRVYLKMFKILLKIHFAKLNYFHFNK
jgi:hypothetical protein